MSGFWTLHLVFYFVNMPIAGVTTVIYGQKGSRVVLLCPYKGGPDAELRWNYDENGSVYSANEHINNITLPPEVYNRLAVVGNYNTGEYNLQISGINESDEGSYRCSIGAGRQDVVTLYLIVPPTSVKLDSVTAQNRLVGTEGQDLLLSCLSVGGKPPPNATLNLDGITLLTGIQSVSYILKSVNRSYDRKTVTCQAYNAANMNNPDIVSGMLYLYLKPLKPTFSLDSVSTDESRPLVVSCTSKGSRPVATFQWYFGQALVSSGVRTVTAYNDTDDTYTVISSLNHIVDRSFNKQILSCRVSNNVCMSAVLASQTLDVKYAPDITVENRTYAQNNNNRSLSCKPVGNPNVFKFFKWRHISSNGVVIRELEGDNNGTVTLPSIPDTMGYHDTGEYLCTASNGVVNTDGNVKQTGSGFVTVNGSFHKS